MIGCSPKVGLASTNFPSEIFCNVYDEDDLQKILCPLENSVPEIVCETICVNNENNGECENQNIILIAENSSDEARSELIIEMVDENVNKNSNLCVSLNENSNVCKSVNENMNVCENANQTACENELIEEDNNIDKCDTECFYTAKRVLKIVKFSIVFIVIKRCMKIVKKR